MNAYYKGQPIFGSRGPAGPDGNPIGTIISFMGLTAPKDYLVCDGTEYPVSDYLALADFFESQFGTKNHFGGDGTVTFAVPDMRNLFLRGFHGEAEKQLSGEVGKQQEATQIQDIGNTNDGKLYFPLGKGITPRYCDEKTVDTIRNYFPESTPGSAEASSYITTRPVNMAVLYCIKAVESIPQEAAGDVYSTEETRVGTWIDGKPLYQRTFTGTIQGYNQWTIIAEIPGMDRLVSFLGTALKNKGTSNEETLQIPSTDVAAGRKYGDGIGVYTSNSANANLELCMTAKYTKTGDEGDAS